MMNFLMIMDLVMMKIINNFLVNVVQKIVLDILLREGSRWRIKKFQNKTKKK